VHEDQLFERWQSLDSEERNGIFPSLFGRMRHIRQYGTKADKEAAERFYMEVEDLIERVEKEIQFRKGGAK
jgi:hypothetical protein